MERILTSSQMREADRYTIDTLGVPEELLIERAGTAVADVVINKFHGGRVLVCVGNGNNGKDGLVVANILAKKHGFSVAVINVSNGIFKLFDKKFDIIIDCVFGTGLNRIIDGRYKIAIEKINASGAYVVSCDIPSGINADTGLVMGIAVKANLTVAIQEYKLGHFINDGIDYCGELIVKDIGISIWGEDYLKRLNDSDVAGFFCTRKRNVHKGIFGKVTIFGGSKSFSGSIILSKNALTALKMGIGYVNMAVPNSLYSGYIGVVPDSTFLPVKDEDGNIVFDKSALNKLMAYDCIAIGMGIGVSEDIYKTIKYLLENYRGILLIDADGLNVISSYGIEILDKKLCKVVLTPHIGEFERLIKVKKVDIMSDIITHSKGFASKYGVILLLKSAVSIITDGVTTYVNTTGSAGMAKGGSGDVLSGIVAGLMARCGYGVDVAAAASYIFGKSGESVEKKQNVFTMTASDIINELPETINSL